jgi:cell pole-organizing protein PopZ
MRMAEAKKAGEEDLSMEEILQSIRKIIAEDGEEAPAGMPNAASVPASDVLELTEMIEEVPAAAPTEPATPASAPASQDAVNDILSKIDQVVVPDSPPVAKAAPMPDSPFTPPPSQEAATPSVVANGQAYIDSLLSPDAATATSAAFKKIYPVETPIVTTPSPHFRTGGSVEDLVMEALRPMLKSWLDINLPNIVERIVEREIKKLVS